MSRGTSSIVDTKNRKALYNAACKRQDAEDALYQHMMRRRQLVRNRLGWHFMGTKNYTDRLAGIMPEVERQLVAEGFTIEEGTR